MRSLIVAKPSQAQGLASFGMTGHFFMTEEEEAAIRKNFLYLLFWVANRHFFLLISNYLNVISNAVRNPNLS